MNKKNKKNDHTPMIKQYLLLKVNYPNMLLFYRMGDFYELFYNDAKKISKLLNITLTHRGFSAGKVVPMSGIPCHVVDVYLNKLIKLGESIVICDQMKELESNKKLFKRKVVRIITPGTVTDDVFLKEHQDNLVAAIWFENDIFGYSTLDLCSGSFNISEHNNSENILSELHRTNPKELLYPEHFIKYNLIAFHYGLKRRPIWEFELSSAISQLNLQFGTTSLHGFGVDHAVYGLRAAGCLLKYVKNTQNVCLRHIKSIKINNIIEYIDMNVATFRNLEIITNISGGNDHTLSSILNHSVTSMGSRMLKRWLNFPIRNINVIKKRQNSIKELQKVYNQLQLILRGISDLERIASRISLRTVSPKDLVCMRETLGKIPIIKKILKSIKDKHIQDLNVNIGNFNNLLKLLEDSISISPAVAIRDGRVIADGYNCELDELRLIQENSNEYLKQFEKKLKCSLGIPSLKIGCNRLIGYYIQISKKFVHLIPNIYNRRQTLKNYERYTVSELKYYEENVLNAKEKSIEIEKKIYKEILDIITLKLDDLYVSSKALAEIDVLTNLSERAITLNYICPILQEDPIIFLENSRHPVVETVLKTPFIPNSVYLAEKKRTIIITGPNMGGKSTYMRQIALIIIMSWIGSFVPATKAIIGNFDKIFVRAGSADKLAVGQSTFMVEMLEISSILNNATSNSLVIIDEIGRGTSTYDGLSLAWASVQYLNKYIKAITLFSTHYFELTLLAKTMKNIQNMYFSVMEYNNQITFMYTIKKGAIKKSYGLLVAILSGLPKKVIDIAKVKLEELESKNNTSCMNLIKTRNSTSLSTDEIINYISSLNPDDITPYQALEIIYFLKNKI